MSGLEPVIAALLDFAVLVALLAGVFALNVIKRL